MKQVEDLFVKPEYRRKGIGKSFFAQLGRIAQEKVRMMGAVRDHPR
jgi:GNAT superfamily N-acetyltransferase